MFGFIAGVPRRIKNLFSKFKKFFSKPQYKNFCRTELGLMVAGGGEHDVKSVNELFIDRKDQSSLNRFITDPKWDVKAVANQAKTLLLSEAKVDRLFEYKIIDDTVCRKYSPSTQMVCYNHSSTMGTVLSHDYVTSLYVNNSLAVPDGLKLYGNQKKCREKGIEFKTRLQLACDILDEHTPLAKKTIWLWDSWFTCQEMASKCKAHAYSWIGEIKSNRVVFYEGKRIRIDELFDKLRSEGGFFDVVLKGEVYHSFKADVFMPKMGYFSIVMNVKANTKDVHFLCTDLVGCSVEAILDHALERHRIEDFYKEAKALGFGEYRFRESEAALIHAHLVVLACILLDVLRRRLLRYSMVRCLPTIGATVEWVRKRAMHLFIHKVREAKLPIKSILRLVDTS
ncbi:MAG TPA: transposase [Candidatus Bathyarchaeia archaeon]|nr:transposase [Candidatus Bathyarchaeia archaeon]